MARYLERLVARARPISHEAVSPPTPVRIDSHLADPFENTALWTAEPPPSSAIGPSLAPVLSTPTQGLQALEAAPQAPPGDGPPTIIHIEPPSAEVMQPTQALKPPTPVSPGTVVRQETLHEVELRPLPAERLEREVRTETLRAETIVEHETISRESARPVSANLPDSPDAGEVERKVLGKLMPVLDAWFSSNTDTPLPTARSSSDEHHRMPLLAPRAAAEREPVVHPASAESPTLVIGAIHVDITPAAPPAPAPTRARTPRAASSSPPQPPSRLRFGLGQM